MMIYSKSFIEVIDTEINRPVLIPIHDITFIAKNNDGKCTIHTPHWRVETAETYETVRSILSLRTLATDVLRADEELEKC